MNNGLLPVYLLVLCKTKYKILKNPFIYIWVMADSVSFYLNSAKIDEAWILS